MAVETAAARARAVFREALVLQAWPSQALTPAHQMDLWILGEQLPLLRRTHAAAAQACLGIEARRRAMKAGQGQSSDNQRYRVFVSCRTEFLPNTTKMLR